MAWLHSSYMCIDRPNKRPPRHRRHGGFTLIEILVALIIFSVMAVLGYRALASVLDTRSALVAHNQKWRSVELFFARIGRDLNSVVARSVRNPANLAEAPLLANRDALGPNGAQLAFTRSGWNNAVGSAADEQRIGYRLRDKRIELLLWPVLDQGPRGEATAYTLLDSVESLQLRYLDSGGNWLDTWGTPNDSSLPKAVELTLKLASGEHLTRLLALP